MDKEYIEREALLEWLCDGDPSRMEDYYYNAIADAPTADVVEVVRCKDCIYNANGSCEMSEDCTDNYRPEYYCADGLRKGEGE